MLWENRLKRTLVPSTPSQIQFFILVLYFPLTPAFESL